jgi:D-3-phosphoglycerate dehydrogenase / 2-oxoglutarate reductase
MQSGSVLIADDAHVQLIKGLIKMGYRVDYFPGITDEEVRSIIFRYHGLIINSKIQADREMMELGNQLRFVARLGSGLEVIDQEFAKEKGIQVYNSPEGNSRSVAEHTLGMLLALMNNLIRADEEVRRGVWNREKNRGIELAGRTVGIIGFGNTGESLARLLSGFNVKVLAYDKYRKDLPKDLDHVQFLKTMEEIMKQSDIISLHLPLTKETFNLVDYSWISGCKQGFIFINTARGKIVKLKDLALALEQGHVSGACLDVFENEKVDTFSEEEKLNYQQICANERVVLSPHVAGWTKESKIKIAEVLLCKINTLQI